MYMWQVAFSSLARLVRTHDIDEPISATKSAFFNSKFFERLSVYMCVWKSGRIVKTIIVVHAAMRTLQWIVYCFWLLCSRNKRSIRYQFCCCLSHVCLICTSNDWVNCFELSSSNAFEAERACKQNQTTQKKRINTLTWAQHSIAQKKENIVDHINFIAWLNVAWARAQHFLHVSIRVNEILHRCVRLPFSTISLDRPTKSNTFRSTKAPACFCFK